jgi:hypothetical protein
MLDSLKTRAERIVLVDAGSFTGSQSGTFELRSLFLCEMMKSLGYDAITLGDGELDLGADLIRSLAADPALPLVSANLVDAATGRPLLATSRVVEKGGVRVGITAVTVPTEVMTPEWAAVGIEARPATEALAGVIRDLRRRSDVVVLLARMSMPQSKQLVEDLGGGIDVVVAANVREGRGRTLAENAGAVFVSAGNRGQALGVAEIALGEGGKIEGTAADEIVLARDIPEDPLTKEIVAEFERNLNEEMRTRTRQQQTSRRSGDGHYYVGVENCASCHRHEYEVWTDTPHSTAFRTLREREKESLPECYGCHVTGNTDPAGYDPFLTDAASLVNVQCEVCHGKGSGHARDGSFGRGLLMDSCRNCHDDENSPDWDPEVYWRMIEH